MVSCKGCMVASLSMVASYYDRQVCTPDDILPSRHYHQVYAATSSLNIGYTYKKAIVSR